MMPNPAVQIITWATLVIALQLVGPATLFAALILLMISAAVYSASRLLLLIRRTRWIIFSMLMIYSYTIPGVAVFPPLGEISPTREGLLAGLLQAARLVSVLASLAILLARLDQQKLVSGVYVLAYPLRFIGLARERIAVRLALTLHYAEAAMLDTGTCWRGSMENLLAPVPAERDSIEFPVVQFTAADSLFLAAAFSLLVLVML